MLKSNWSVRLLIIGALVIVGIGIAIWGPSFSSDDDTQTAGNGTATPSSGGPGAQDVANVKDQIDFIIKDSSGREKQSGSLGN